MLDKKIKIGFLISNTRHISCFYAKVIERVLLDDRYIAEFVILKESNKISKASVNTKILALIVKLEIKLFRIKNYPNSYVDISYLLSKVKSITVHNQVKAPYVRLSNTDLDSVKKEEFDILFRIGWGIIKGDILNLPKHGIWSLHHGDYKKFRGKPALFWELYSGLKYAGCMLQKLTSNLDDGYIIDSLYSSINEYSYSKSVYILYYKSMEMLFDNFEKLFTNETIRINKKLVNIYTNQLFKTPNNSTQFKFFLKLFFRNAIRKLNFNKTKWHIAMAPISKSKEIRNYKIIPNRKGYFSADPFLIEYNNEEYIFFEEASLKDSIGHISYIKCNDFSVRGVALKENFHLSFPNVFSYEGDIYMIPESRKSMSIRLYKCINFPDKWELKSILMDNISACDSEIIHMNNKFYLFTNISKNEYTSNADNLCIFISDNIIGPYMPHINNPITRDCRNSRMAGKIILDNGIMYRVAQSGEFGYGSALVLNKIDKLSNSEYSETKIQTISKTVFNEKGIHTLNFGNKHAVIDILIPET